MREDFGDHCRIFDGGDDLKVATTLRAVFEVDSENAFEQARARRENGSDAGAVAAPARPGAA